jgi:hypothetical protein
MGSDDARLPKGRALARAQWCVRHDMFLFYGDGGHFCGPDFDRWLADVENERYRGYLGATGMDFRLTAVERSRGRAEFLKRKMPFATVTDSLVVRGLVTTGHWMGLNINAFSWTKIDRAFEWLQAVPTDIPELVATVHRLRQEVDLANRMPATG